MTALCILGAGCSTDLPRTDRERAALSDQPFEPHLGEAERIADMIVQGNARLREFHNRAHLQVILQILTHFGASCRTAIPCCRSRPAVRSRKSAAAAGSEPNHRTGSPPRRHGRCDSGHLADTEALREPSNTISVTCARVCISRLGRDSAGCRKAVAALSASVRAPTTGSGRRHRPTLR